MITPLITLADFPDFVPFSVNIGPLLVTHAIRDAHTLDVEPLLSPAQWAAVATVATPDPNATPDPLLVTLWTDGVRPLLVCESARRMLLWHGAHVTPNGVETISDIGHAPIPSAQRTELRGDLQAKCSFYRARLEIALKAYAPTVSTGCASPTRRPLRGGLQISAI